MTAIGLTRTQARRTLRFGIGRETTPAEIERAAALIMHAATRHQSARSNSI
ncbi:hypothetical protein [Streptomyces sp. NPDC057939]|uniref:hypothetical protein n=1 Tax=Streptomyces sp. NPDC057939 TaxID=3346284 RepID=UPI0036E07A9F